MRPTPLSTEELVLKQSKLLEAAYALIAIYHTMFQEYGDVLKPVLRAAWKDAETVSCDSLLNTADDGGDLFLSTMDSFMQQVQFSAYCRLVGEELAGKLMDAMAESHGDEHVLAQKFEALVREHKSAAPEAPVHMGLYL